MRVRDVRTEKYLRLTRSKEGRNTKFRLSGLCLFIGENEDFPPKISLLSYYFLDKSRRAVKRHFTAHFDRDNAAVRQLTLGNVYSKLLELSEVSLSERKT